MARADDPGFYKQDEQFKAREWMAGRQDNFHFRLTALDEATNQRMPIDITHAAVTAVAYFKRANSVIEGTDEIELTNWTDPDPAVPSVKLKLVPTEPEMGQGFIELPSSLTSGMNPAPGQENGVPVVVVIFTVPSAVTGSSIMNERTTQLRLRVTHNFALPIEGA